MPIGRSFTQETPDSRFQRVPLLELTLPDNHHRPTGLSQLTCLLPITSLVRCDFRLPVVQPALGQPAVPAGMPMPEAPVHEDHFPSAYECQVGSPWEIATSQRVSVAKSVHHRADSLLRAGVSRMDRCHYLASSCLCDSVHRLALTEPAQRPRQTALHSMVARFAPARAEPTPPPRKRECARVA